METNLLHIVSFDVPWPADYGGVMDVFYKLKAIAQTGKRIHLHAFTHERVPASELEQYCTEVTYYRRTTTPSRLLSRTPYIVASRDGATLLQNILKEPAPVLLEGLHTTWHLAALKAAGLAVMVRAHNVEHRYYLDLAGSESNPFRKLYFLSEAAKLEGWESILHQSDHIGCISKAELAELSVRYGAKRCFYLPAFHPFEQVAGEPGIGQYVLYHGKLSVPENHKAAMYLLHEVFADDQEPLIIAGHQPEKALRKAVANRPNTTLIANPDGAQMDQLIREAHVHVLPTFQDTGIKLKLLHALFRGRHVVANKAMLGESGLDALCTLAESSKEIRSAVQQLREVAFTNTDIEHRMQVLGKDFSNAKNARLLLEKLEAVSCRL